MYPSNKLAVEEVLKWLNITFKDKKITDLDKNDWKQFRKIVEDSINLYRG